MHNQASNFLSCSLFGRRRVVADGKRGRNRFTSLTNSPLTYFRIRSFRLISDVYWKNFRKLENTFLTEFRSQFCKQSGNIQVIGFWILISIGAILFYYVSGIFPGILKKYLKFHLVFNKVSWKIYLREKGGYLNL